MFDIFVHYWWQYIIVAAASCLVGSINFSILFSHLFKKTDVRNYGSGNPGTTNMFRVFGLPMGLLTFLFDALKGVSSCLISYFVFTGFADNMAARTAMCIAGLFAVVGHVFPVYYGLRGGKGVATSIGVMFCLDPILSLCSMPVVLAVILITDRMSVMSMLYAVFNIVWAWCVFLPRDGAFCCTCLTVMFLIVLFAHRHNLVRLLKGHELPTGVRKALRGKSDPEFERNQSVANDDESQTDLSTKS